MHCEGEVLCSRSQKGLTPGLVNPEFTSLTISLHLYLSSVCQVAHKASISCPQPSLSAAAMHTSFHDLHLALPLSLSTVLLHVTLGLPCFQRLSLVHVNAVLQSLSVSFLMMCPINYHPVLRTSSLSFLTPDNSCAILPHLYLFLSS